MGFDIRSTLFSKCVSKYSFSEGKVHYVSLSTYTDTESLTKIMVKEYLGDSATLSYLQIIRKDVESIAGPCPFTIDPRQHRIVENTTTLPRNVRNTHLLPDKATANILLDAFFTNVSKLNTSCCRRLLIVSRQVEFVGSLTKPSSEISTATTPIHYMSILHGFACFI